MGINTVAGVDRFGGIPFAVPPLGIRRFARAEVSHGKWNNGQLDAQRLSPPCIQNPLGDPRGPTTDSPEPTEDCLKLNIWRPSTIRTPLPVLVYVHGGGLCAGWSGNAHLNGTKLALQHDVIVVTVNYRLGALGFLTGEDAGRPGSGGMNGLYDVIIALRWLKDYVSYFGGDASQMTVFGQSSGAYGLCTLLVAPAAQNLFRRAALLSGPCLNGGPPGRGWGPMSRERGLNVTQELLQAFGATRIDDLRKVQADKLLAWKVHDRSRYRSIFQWLL